MRVAFGVLIRFLVPLVNKLAKGWNDIRGIRIINNVRNLGASRTMFTSLFALAANTISMSLSSVQGKS